ncbi:protein ALP1-like isoform X2 [Athalia rosae]|uniref:protein ALP1-like isoform X2 n=1 Tax=Athalia rosae TaxID=37344 RepID=UPI002033DE0B|nr:protein ALP1-like isoform X2 [Athalia rosae]
MAVSGLFWGYGWDAHSNSCTTGIDRRLPQLYANVGAPGRCTDASIFRRSRLFTQFSGAQNEQPQLKTNLHIISDAAFPLLPWIMKPFPITIDMALAQRIFNYRLSSARMTVENSFGRLKGPWRIILKRADLTLDNMKKVVKTCLILHNLCEKAGDIFYPKWTAKGQYLEEKYGKIPSVPIPDRRAPVIAKIKQDMLAERLMNDGVSIDSLD